MHALICQLETSHTAFFHKNFRPLPGRQAICTTVQKSETDGRSVWTIQDVQEDGPGHRAGLERGDVLVSVNGQKIGPSDTPLFSIGKPTTLIVRKRDGKEKRIQLDVPPFQSSKRPFAIPEPVQYSILGDGMGYLKVNMFPGVVGIDVSRDIDRVVSHFRSCHRLIVDPRGNSGGGISGRAKPRPLQQPYKG